VPSRRLLVVLAAVGSLLVFAGQALAQPKPGTVGRLVAGHGDVFATGRMTRPRYAVVTASHAYPVKVGPLDAALLGREVRVGAHGALRAAVQRTAAAATSTSGTKRVAVLLFNFSNDTSRPYTPAYARGVAFTNPDSVAAYYADSSWGQLTLTGDVYGWYTIPYSSATCNVDAWATAANSVATAAGVNLGAYTNIVYAFPLASSCAWNGWSDLPGSRAWLNGPNAMTTGGMAHELGHNFGLNHASSTVCTVSGVKVALSANSSNCTTGEYGDPFSVMGSAKHYSQTGFARGSLGFLTPANTQTVTASGDYTLAPIETYDPTGVQVLRIPRASGTYLSLELRQPSSPFDTFSGTDAAVNGLLVRITPDYTAGAHSLLVDTTPGSMMSFFDAALGVGRTLVDPLTGISITTLDISPLGAIAHVTYPGGGSISDTTPPSQPGTLTATPVDANDVTLAWSASSDNAGVAGYRIYRNSSLVATVTSTGYNDGGLTAATSYTYQVVAVDAAGNASVAAVATATTSALAAAPPPAAGDTSAPTAPANLTATLGKSKKVSLSWNASTDDVGVAGYRVYRNGALLASTTSPGYTDTAGGKSSITYYVVAYDGAGNTSGASGSVTVQP